MGYLKNFMDAKVDSFINGPDRFRTPSEWWENHLDCREKAARATKAEQALRRQKLDSILYGSGSSGASAPTVNVTVEAPKQELPEGVSQEQMDQLLALAQSKDMTKLLEAAKDVEDKPKSPELTEEMQGMLMSMYQLLDKSGLIDTLRAAGETAGTPYPTPKAKTRQQALILAEDEEEDQEVGTDD